MASLWRVVGRRAWRMGRRAPGGGALAGAAVVTRHVSGWKNFHTTTMSTSPWVRSLKWTSLPLGVGFGLFAYRQHRLVRTGEPIVDAGIELISDWQLTLYRLLPLRSFSRLWGHLNNIELPVWAREPALSIYAKWFGCNLEEAEFDTLEQYSNLGQFFRRRLKPLVRKIHSGDCMVSPADGVVLSCGMVSNNKIEQVKGVAYSLDSFFGTDVLTQALSTENADYSKALLTNPKENALFHFVVYLAPGDYHRFHSPVDWEIHYRRHFAGDLLSVNPRMAQWIPGLFALNERAVYVGKWKYGFFSVTAVGATNVGSIRIYKDSELQTNCKHQKKGAECSRTFSRPKETLTVAKGEPFGEFNLGSTIVLVFEAPRHYRFKCRPGERILVGNLLSDPHVAKQSNQLTNVDSTTAITGALTSKNWLEYSLQTIMRQR